MSALVFVCTNSLWFQALLCFLMLVYIHVKFTRNPVHCLEGVKDTWPRDGILRVEIMRNAPDDYDVEKSYGISYFAYKRTDNVD